MVTGGIGRFARPAIVSGIMVGLASALIGSSQLEAAPQAAPSPSPIAISSVVPKDLNPAGGGAPQASMTQAAQFAWQEFIALNWPAKMQTGQSGDRDTPAADCLFGDPKCSGRPLTWQTFRGKAEIFTAGAVQPYDQIPTYADVYYSKVPSCDGSPDPKQGAWVNLDETDEITLDAMYAGVGPSARSPANAAPQLVRFMAKANRAEFDYVQLIGAGNGPSRALRAATVNYFKTQGNPPAGGTNYVSLPNNTVEIKAGWRMLNPAKEDVTRFTTTKVRYYENQGTSGGQCYREAVFGLVALHIIQKTPSAPYFIYASFEQSDNILTPDGKPVEDADGNIVNVPPCRGGQRPPCPTTPAVTLNDTATTNPPSQIPPNVTRVPGTSPYCTASTATPPKNQLYYLNSSASPALPSGGYVCVNSRDNPIPGPVVATNKAAHAAIAAYNKAKGIARSPWQFYKLVNVQYVPIDKAVAGRYSGNDPNTSRNAASYYLANIVVETNRPLQLFSGGLVGAIGGVGGTGSNSDYASQFGETGGGTHKNTFFNTTGNNMGGCMGCHGSQGQSVGADFSVILSRGVVGMPQTPPSTTRTGALITAPPSRRLVYGR